VGLIIKRESVVIGKLTVKQRFYVGLFPLRCHDFAYRFARIHPPATEKGGSYRQILCGQALSGGSQTFLGQLIFPVATISESLVRTHLAMDWSWV